MKMKSAFAAALSTTMARDGVVVPALSRRAHVSKHRQIDDDGFHIPGACKIGEHSSLRKLMRAARRGKIPEERMLTISVAQTNAQIYRTSAWINSHARARA